MLTINDSQMEQLAIANFMQLLDQRFSALGEAPMPMSAQERQSLWTAVISLKPYGITTIRGGLVVAHILCEMGLDCLEKLPAFKAIIEDPQAMEADKVDALWLVRTQLFAALAEP